MNKNLKKELKTAFNAPEPSRKGVFLKQLTFPKASQFDFVRTQISYIRKRYWLLSMLLFVVVLGVFYKSETSLSVVWISSSILPFLGLLSISELARSMSYNMVELEMSCRHHFTEIILVRLTILGTVQAIVLIATIFLIGGRNDMGFLRTALYLITPFMMNTYMTLAILNRLQSRQTLTICATVTGIISVMSSAVISQYSMILGDPYKVIWWIVFIMLLGVIAYELKKMIKETEELKWNLLLTV